MAIEDLIDKIFDDNPVEAQKEFESELQQKLSVALDTKKKDTASSIFGGVKPEETPAVEDEPEQDQEVE